jgi:type III pantothenate kinase
MIAPRDSDTSPSLILMDIGNTRIALGEWTGVEIENVEHVPTEPTQVVAESLTRLWKGLPPGSKAFVVSSVNPPVLSRLRNLSQELGFEPMLVLGEDINPPMTADLPDPSCVGMDRLCTGAAAFAKVKGVCAVADFGTALTIDLISDDGVYLGGTIMPGISMSARALHEHTALLPLVEVGVPSETLGKDTESAIRNGIFAMMIGALREITERYATQIGKWPPLIVTGGNGEAIAAQAEFVDRVIPNLSLEGILLAYRLHTESDERE